MPRMATRSPPKKIVADDTTQETEDLAEGTLLSHLVELRSRLLKTAAAVVGIFIILLPFSRRIFSLVSEPLREFLPGNQMIATEVASPLLTPFKLTFFVALFLAMPVVLYQLWAFVAPGLLRITSSSPSCSVFSPPSHPKAWK